MSNTSMPGFTADESLRRSTHLYAAHGNRSMEGSSRGISPSRIRLPPDTGCGPCTELTWPNGRGTGACQQECCDVLGNCKLQACPCPGPLPGGGFFFFG
jgi:hypothetical protein